MALESSSTLQQTDEVAAAAGGGGAVGGGGGGVSELEAFEYDTDRLTLGTGLSSKSQSNNSSVLQNLANRASGGRKILQLPSGVIEHDEPIHFYPDGSNTFDQYGRLRLEGVTDYTRSSPNLQGTTLKYTGDPSLTPYQFGGGVFESQRYRVNGLNFVGTTNTNVPLVKVQSTFQQSEFTDLYVQQEGDGHGMIARDCWVSNFERIFCTRPNSNQPQLTGIGFQFHNRDFSAGNTSISRVTGSGFRYGVVIGGLEYGEGAGQVTTYTERLQGQNCYVGVVHGFGGGGGFDHNLYAEGCTKASLWVINRGGRTVRNLYSFIGDDGKSNVQIGMSRGASGGSYEMPFTGTTTDDIAGALRDTNTDFGTYDKGIAVGDPVYNTTGSKPYPRAFVQGIKTERQRGNGASGAVHELTLTSDIFDAGDDYSISPDLDDYTATASQKDSNNNYDGETKPTGLQAAARGVDIGKCGFALYRGVGVLYHASADTLDIRVGGAGGDQKAGATTSTSANRLIDSNVDFTGGQWAVHIGDRVVNRDTGASTTVTDIVSSTELELAADIFTTTGQAYAVSGAQIVQNSQAVNKGTKFENITNRFGASRGIANPDFVGRETNTDPASPDRQSAPQEVSGVQYEETKVITGDYTVTKSPTRVWEQYSAYTVFADGGDVTVTLPDPSDAEVQGRTLKINRGDDVTSNSATVAATNANVRGPTTTGGSLSLSPLEGVILQAQVDESGMWGWNAIGPATNQIPADFGNDGSLELDPIQKISTTGDTKNVFSTGGDPGELLVDLDPIAERAEDETITGVWDHSAKLLISSAGHPVQYDNANVLTSLEVDQSPGTVLQVNGGNAPFRMNIEDGSGRYKLRWNAYFDGSSVRYDAGSEAATQVNIGDNFHVERAPGGTAGNTIPFNSAIYADDDGQVAFGHTLPAFQADIQGVGRSDTRLQAPEFESDQTDYAGGWAGSGYQLAEVGYNSKPDFAEFSHLSVRGTLRVRELEVRQITFSKGPFGVSPGAGKLGNVASSSHTPISNTFSSATLQEWTFENSGDAEERHGMASGDRILAQRFDPSNQTVVAQVRAVVDDVPDQYTIEVSVDDAYTVPATGEDEEGYEFVVVASTNSARDNFIFFNPYDPSNTAYDGLSDFNDWDNRSEFVRHRSGNLNSYYDYTSDAYGMAAGDHEGNYITADATNGVRIVDNNGGNNLVRALFSGDQIRMGDPSDHYVNITDTQIRMFDDNGRRMVLVRGGNNSSVILGDNANNNEHIRISENGLAIWDGSSQRARLIGTELMLGNSASEHIVIDPNQSGVQMINANGTEVGRFDGSLLRLGSSGDIVFDPSQSPEAKIDGTLQMSTSGQITNANDDFRLDDDGLQLEQVGTFNESNALTFYDSGFNSRAFRIWSTGGVGGQTRLEAENPSGTSHDIRVETTPGAFKTKTDAVQFDVGGASKLRRVGFDVVNDGVAQLFREPMLDEPTNTQLESSMGPQEVMLYSAIVSGNLQLRASKTDSNGDLKQTVVVAFV